MPEQPKTWAAICGQCIPDWDQMGERARRAITAKGSVEGYDVDLYTGYVGRKCHGTVRIYSPGCGATSLAGGGTCRSHLDEYEPDGFAIHWHTSPAPERGRTLWHYRPNTHPVY